MMDDRDSVESFHEALFMDAQAGLNVASTPLQPLGRMSELAVSKEAKSLRGRVRRSDLVLTVIEYGPAFFCRGWAWT